MQLAELQANHRDFLLALAAEHGLSDVRVFGSVARGDAGPGSDLDLLVRIGPKVSLFTLMDFEERAGQSLGLPVQVVTEGGVSPFLRERVFQEALPL